MFERFTNKARRVLSLANEEARRFNHEYVGTEHILLGLVKEDSGVGANVIKNLGVDLRKVRLEVEKLLKSGSEVTAGNLPQTPRAKRVINDALEEARDLNHNYVGTEHLLLALFRDGSSTAAIVLQRCNIHLSDVRKEISDLLGENQNMSVLTKIVYEKFAKTLNDILGSVIGSDAIIIAFCKKHLWPLYLEYTEKAGLLPQSSIKDFFGSGTTLETKINEYITQGINDHIGVIRDLESNSDLLQSIAAEIAVTLKNEGKVLIIGNGGSAADAQHIAAELVGNFKKRGRRPLAVLALTTDTSVLTATGNDFGFDEIFSRQIEALATYKDIVWALSVSGQSPNILNGLRAAKKIGCINIGFTGLGGSMPELCNYLLTVKHESVARVQEVHQLAYHLICESLDRYSSEEAD